MQEINKFIEEARKKNLDDAAIRQALEQKGWDKTAIDVALTGIEVPEPPGPAAAPFTPTPVHAAHPTLPPLMAALHHVILWFFTGSSAIAIVATVSLLYGSEVNSTVLASMIAVTLITFIPYAVLFAIFLRKTYKEPRLIPGKVWSIITICLHSIGTMSAAIAATIAIITVGAEHPNFLVSSLLVLGLDLLVVIIYSITLSTERTPKLRKGVLTIYLPLLLVLFGALFGLSLAKLMPVRHDEQTRKDLAETVRTVHKYTQDNKKLPESASQFSTKPGVTYKKTGAANYEVCAAFEVNTASNDSYGAPPYSTFEANISDDYVYDEMFTGKGAGTQCFSISAYELKDQVKYPADAHVLTP